MAMCTTTVNLNISVIRKRKKYLSVSCWVYILKTKQTKNMRSKRLAHMNMRQKSGRRQVVCFKPHGPHHRRNLFWLSGRNSRTGISSSQDLEFRNSGVDTVGVVSDQGHKKEFHLFIKESKLFVFARRTTALLWYYPISLLGKRPKNYKQPIVLIAIFGTAP